VQRSPRIGRFAIVLRAPRFPRLIPVLCRGTVRAETPPFEWLLPLHPRGLRSGPGCSVPFPHTCGPIRPTPISPLSGLYEMPSLCTLRLGDRRVVPRFRCPSFLTCRPLRLRGERKPVGSHSLRRQVRTATKMPVFHETPGIGAATFPVKAIQSPKGHGGFLNCPSSILRSAGGST
jgi:hypothetical protein